MAFRRLIGLAMIASLAMTTRESVLEAAPSQPTETRTIDNFEQLGIDTPAPRFAWVISDPVRGALQSAYQIIVAPSQVALASGTHSVWDSGKVTSSQQYGVEYAGAALEKTTEYWWKVRSMGCAGTGFTLERRPLLRHIVLYTRRLELGNCLDRQSAGRFNQS